MTSFNYKLINGAGRVIQSGQFTSDDLPNCATYVPGDTDMANAQRYADATILDQDPAIQADLHAEVFEGGL